MNPTQTSHATDPSVTVAAPALLERQRPALRSYLAHLTGGVSAPVDGWVEEVFAELGSVSATDAPEDPVEWLFAEGRKRAVAAGHRREASAGGEEEAAEAGAEEVDDPRVTVLRAIERSTPKQQEALRLRFQYGFHLDELARIMGLTKAGAAALLHLAVGRIGRALQAGSGAASAGIAGSLSDDPSVTAYALDEMDDAERKVFERNHAGGQVLVDTAQAIRGWAVHISEVLAIGDGAEALMRQNRKRRRRSVWWRSPKWIAGLAVGIAAVAAVSVHLISRRGVEPPAAASARSDAGTPNAAVQRDNAAQQRRSDARAAQSRQTKPATDAGLGFEFIPGEARKDRPYGKSTGVGGGGESGGSVAVGAPGAANLSNGGSGPPPTAGGATGAGQEAGGVANAGGGVGASESSPAQSGAARGEAGDQAPESYGIATGGGAGAGAFPAGAAAGLKTGDAAATLPPRQSGGAGEDRVIEPGEFSPAAEQRISRLPAESAAPSVPALRRALKKGEWPTGSSIRVAEMINYAPVELKGAASEEVFSAEIEVAQSPWSALQRLVRVTVKANDAPVAARGRANLVLAIDVSGSMEGENRLPLVQESVRRLVDRLAPEDRVAVVTYSGAAQVALPSVPAARAGELRECLAGLEAAGKTNGAEGLHLAYAVSRESWIEGGINAVVLCTDGNFNLGTTDAEELAKSVAVEAEKGIRLSVIGFGRNDRNDVRLQLLAVEGRGGSRYVNTQVEAERALVEQIDGLLATAADDVRMDVEFNPERVAAFRMVGEQRTVAQDHDQSGVGAAMLAGHAVTALYEVLPSSAGGAIDAPWLTVNVGYVEPRSGQSRRQSFSLGGHETPWEGVGVDFRFAAAVAEFGNLLRGAPPSSGAAFERIESWARESIGSDRGGYRSEFLYMVEQARRAAGFGAGPGGSIGAAH